LSLTKTGAEELKKRLERATRSALSKNPRKTWSRGTARYARTWGERGCARAGSGRIIGRRACGGGGRVRIIDGYNLIGAAGGIGLTLAQPDKEERLLRLLAAWRARRRSREPLLVVFDGDYGRLAKGPRRSSRAGIDVEWAVGESADALLLRRVRGAARPREIEVVTSDRAVAREAASHGARVVRSADFLATIAPAPAEGQAPEKPEAPTADEVGEWLEQFGGGETEQG